MICRCEVEISFPCGSLALRQPPDGTHTREAVEDHVAPCFALFFALEDRDRNQLTRLPDRSEELSLSSIFDIKPLATMVEPTLALAA